ncbi:hypothetical protein ACVMH6_004941 [Rhizobium leguminosarum]|jgi:hypothetical protein
MLNLDATDDPLHSHQEGPVISRVLRIATDICRFTSSVAATCVSAKLRRSNIDASAGSVAEIDRIVAQIREICRRFAQYLIGLTKLAVLPLKRLHLPSQANVRSTTQRRGSTAQAHVC